LVWGLAARLKIQLNDFITPYFLYYWTITNLFLHVYYRPVLEAFLRRPDSRFYPIIDNLLMEWLLESSYLRIGSDAGSYLLVENFFRAFAWKRSNAIIACKVDSYHPMV